MKGKRLSPVALIVLLAASFALLAGCNPTLVQTDPELPPGFLETQVPVAELNAYLYMSQEQPTIIPLELLLAEVPVLSGSSTAIISGFHTEVGIQRMAAWMGPDLQSFGASFRFQDVQDATFVEEQMAERAREAVQSWRDGADLQLARGSGPWVEGLRSALSNGSTVDFQEAYPEVWKLIRLLPTSPPGEVVAAGFLRPTSTVIDSLAARAGLDLGRFGPALGTVNVKIVAFAAYSNQRIVFPTEVTPEYIQENQIGAIYIARSSYPGFILSFFLDRFAGRVDLEETQVIGETVLYREYEDVYLMVKVLGNTIFFTLAPSRDYAQELMAAVLAPQVE